MIGAFHPDDESNEAKEAMKDVVLSESIASKLAQTFVDSEVMETTITQFIRKRVEVAITDAKDKRTATMFPKNMSIDEKTTRTRFSCARGRRR